VQFVKGEYKNANDKESEKDAEEGLSGQISAKNF